MNGVENRARLAARPHCVAVDTQVRQAQAEAACLRVIASFQCLDGGSVLAGQKGGQGGVLVAVGDRVQAQRCCLRRRRDVGGVQPQPPLAVRMGGVDRDRACRLLVAPGQEGVGTGPYLV